MRKSIVTALLLTLGIVFTPYVASAVGFVMSSAPPGLNTTNLTSVVVNITNWVLGFVTVIAVLMLIWGGINYLTAAGDESQIDTAKHIITYSIIGLVVVGISYAVVNVVVSCWIGGTC